MAPKEKVSLSIDRDLISEVRRKIGKRELSSFLNEALERRLQADAVEGYLGEADERLGPVPSAVAESVENAYARRFDRIRLAKLRRRIAQAFALSTIPAAVRAEVETALLRGDGIDLVGLQRRAVSEHVLLESIVGAHPRISIKGQTVNIIDIDPDLDQRASVS